jgi:hypothetical protein
MGFSAVDGGCSVSEVFSPTGLDGGMTNWGFCGFSGLGLGAGGFSPLIFSGAGVLGL